MSYAKKGSEKWIQKKIIDWLKTTGLVFWRQNSGWANMGNRMIRLGDPGLPDIFVIIPPHGKILGLEVKTLTGKVRPAQKEMAERVVNSGGVYRIVRSLEAAKYCVAEVLGSERNYP